MNQVIQTSTHLDSANSANAAANFLAFVDDAASKVSVEKLLSSYALIGDQQREVKSGGLDAAVQYLSTHNSPSILLVDISTESQPLVRMAELANVCQPETKVILLGSDNSIDLYRALTNLGVHDYVTKPLNQQQVAEVIGRALGKSVAQGRTAQQLVVTGCGGGVGVSTLVANISRGLAAKGAQTLAADLNSYGGDLDLLFGATANFGLMNLLSGQQAIDKLFIERSCSQVEERLYVLKSVGQQQTFSAERYQALAQQLGQHYNYLVWDLASHLFTVPGIMDLWLAADTKVIVCQPTLAGLRQAKALLSLVAEREHGQRLILVLNYIHPTKDVMLTEAQMEQQLGQKFDHVLPYAPKIVTKAADLGETLLKTSHAFGRALNSLLADIWGQAEVTQPSLLARFRKRF